MRSRLPALAACLWSGLASAQDAPLSAIDWLSNSIEAPGGESKAQAPTTENALPETIVVRPLDRRVPDSVGLVSPETADLPPDLWSASDARTLGRQLAGMAPGELAATQTLLREMLTVEADPPRDSAGGQAFFLARVDALLTHAAFDAAREMMDRAGYDRPAIFRRWFDLALLTGDEDRACARMRALPEITPTYPARIFCLARSGDWPAAAVTLETARALGVVTPAETERLTRFLDEFSGAVALPPSDTPSPLDYLLYEAIGEPLRSPALPLPFAHADLRRHVGWKAQIAAAERLAHAGAIDEQALAEIYARRAPAASGEPWDRVAAWQALDAAIEGGDAGDVSKRLPLLWAEMRSARLLPVTARWIAPAIADLALDGAARRVAVEAALLSGRWADGVDDAPTPLLRQIAGGKITTGTAEDGEPQAVLSGLTTAEPPTHAAGLLADGRTGEALLYAIDLIERGAAGSLDALSDGLAILREAGLDTHARSAAIEVLLTEPRS